MKKTFFLALLLVGCVMVMCTASLSAATSGNFNYLDNGTSITITGVVMT